MTMLDLNHGALAPVTDEVDLSELTVVGRIPPELNGMLVRNGPNPLHGRFEGSDVLSWWPEAAMLHGISFRHGQAVAYRNRWVRTQRWADVHAPEQSHSMPDSNPNVNVICHAGEILALAEGGPPLAIDSGLQTLGSTRRHAGLAEGVTAHPRIDPHTGELISFRAHWQQPWLRYGVCNDRGEQCVDIEIPLPAPSMMHDMAVSEHHSIFLDLNVAYDFSMLDRGFRLPLRWHDERQSRLGVMPRHGGSVRWFDITPCFIQHVVNAHDQNPTTIVVDAVRYPHFLRIPDGGAGFEDNPLGVLWRYVIDLDKGSVTETQLDDRGIELPRINEQRTGRAYRYAYAVEQPSNTQMRGLVQYDLEAGTSRHFRLPPGDQNSEPVFVPRPGSHREDDGWLLVCVYRQATDTTDIVILDAANIDQPALATVHLPRRIPAGFHGAWIPHST